MNLKQFYMGRAIGFVVIIAIAVTVFVVWKPRTSTPSTPTPDPTTLTADQVIVADTHLSSPAPAGYQSLKDTGINATFNAPIDWKPAYLPEGDGKASIVSPDFSDPLGTMTGAYLHYSYATVPSGFPGGQGAYLASLMKGLPWTQTTLDGHDAYITKTSDGFSMVISQFGDNWFVTVNFVDPAKKYGSVFDEFLRSFRAFTSNPNTAFGSEGDILGAMTIVRIAAFNTGQYSPDPKMMQIGLQNIRVILRGPIEVTGTYTAVHSAIGFDGYCMSVTDAASLARLPVLSDGVRSHFCFRNTVFAQQKLGEGSRVVTVTIDNYELESYPAEVMDWADLISVVKG